MRNEEKRKAIQEAKDDLHFLGVELDLTFGYNAETFWSHVCRVVLNKRCQPNNLRSEDFQLVCQAILGTYVAWYRGGEGRCGEPKQNFVCFFDRFQEKKQ